MLNVRPFLQFIHSLLAVSLIASGTAIAADAGPAPPPFATTDGSRMPIYSAPGVEAPELAKLGSFAVGFRQLEMSHSVPDIARVAGGVADATRQRTLQLLVWYPAAGTADVKVRMHYAGALPFPGGDKSPVPYALPGLAQPDAQPAPLSAGARRPLVVLSHGFSGRPSGMVWLAENLASKGYVVAAPWHEDGPFTGPPSLVPALLYRMLDQRAVIREMGSLSDGQGPLKGLVDPASVAVIGYSMGGYGALSLTGAGLDPAGVLAARMPGGLLAPYTDGDPRLADQAVPGLKAVVLMAPWGGQSGIRAWSAAGLARVRLPLLMIAGDQDDIAQYADGVRRLFDGTVNSDRALLVFQNAGHSIGNGGAPPEAAGIIPYLEYFEDPVWKKERILGIELHMITAFLDRYLKGDGTRAGYLQPATVRSNDGVWAFTPGMPGDGAYSPGSGEITVWKGFQRRWSKGLELHRAAPGK
jgi:predicted dienelactone hydrolase